MIGFVDLYTRTIGGQYILGTTNWVVAQQMWGETESMLQIWMEGERERDKRKEKKSLREREREREQGRKKGEEREEEKMGKKERNRRERDRKCVRVVEYPHNFSDLVLCLSHGIPFVPSFSTHSILCIHLFHCPA